MARGRVKGTKLSPETREKMSKSTINRSLGQYQRNCDRAVGEAVRLANEEYYNKILERIPVKNYENNSNSNGSNE